jgi:hypothetical protein
VSRPPNVGPAIEARLNVPVKSPMYLPRSIGEKMSPSVANTDAKIIPPPMPCTARNMMSVFIDGAAPQAADATMKMKTPPIRNSFRPNMSPSFPTSGMMTVDDSM